MLEQHHIILASNSPRRKELLSGLGIPFEVKVLPDISESYPADLPVAEIAQYIACEKAAAYQQLMAPDDLVITADTVVICDHEVLGKPVDADDASRMLHLLSGRTHQVITGVCLMTRERQRAFSVKTDVTFKTLSDEEIHYYLPALRQGRCLRHPGVDWLHWCHRSPRQLLQCHGPSRPAHLRGTPHLLLLSTLN